MGNITDAEWQALWVSVSVAGTGLLVTMPLALLTGWALARWTFWGKTALDILVHLPLVMPPVALGYLLLLALGPRGPLGSVLESWFGVSLAFSWSGAVLVSAVSGFPLAVRAIRISAENVEERLMQAARTLGQSPLGAFVTVALPLMLPGIVAGAVLAFARALGEFGATITFAASIPGETRTLPLALHSFLQLPGGEDAALRVLALSVTVAVAALVTSEILVRRATRR
jgi:molybdate transport system permease protein